VYDFGIPIYFQHAVSCVHGKDRVEKVDVVRLDDQGGPIPDSQFGIFCDTLLISVGLIPENELIEAAGVVLDKDTNAPVSEKLNTTSIAGIFVCGNASKVYDVADSVTRDSELAGKMAAEYIAGIKTAG
jgi:thioredoxin reductase